MGTMAHVMGKKYTRNEDLMNDVKCNLMNDVKCNLHDF